MPFPIKPRIPKINFNHPITKGLVFDVPIFERGSTDPAELVYKLKGTFVGTPTWYTDQVGAGINFDNATTDRITFTTPPAQNNLTKLSVEILFIMNTGGTDGNRLFQKGTTGIQANRYWQVGEYVAGNGFYHAGDWTQQGAWKTAIPSTGIIHHIVTTYDGSSTANDPIVYLDSKVQSLTEVVTPSGTRATDSTIAYIGGSHTSTESWNGKIFYVRMWNRLLQSIEVKQLYSNPWQVYNPVEV
jgi:hypothetical protein